MTAEDVASCWVEFPEGRARFSGGIRGVDERGHDTVAVGIGKQTYYGEARRSFMPNGNDFNVEIVSFGYLGKENVGEAPFDARQPLTLAQLETARILLVGLVQKGLSFAERPRVLTEYPDSRYMGKVLFRDGWALVQSPEGDDA